MLALLLTAVLCQEGAAAAKLTATGAVVYPSGPYWGTWKGAISSESHSLSLLNGIVKETCDFQSSPAPVGVLWSVRETVGQASVLAEATTGQGKQTGFASEDLKTVRLIQADGIRAYAPSEIETLKQLPPLSATLQFADPVPEAEVELRAFCHGVNWEPVYRIYLGAEQRARFTLSAVLKNWGPEPFQSNAVRLAATDPGRNEPAHSLFDGALYEWGPAVLAPFSSASKKVLDAETSVRERVIWRIGQVELAGIDAAMSDSLSTELVVTPPTEARTLPGGLLLVFQGDRPVAQRTWPGVEEGREAVLTMGPPAGIEVRKEETELERKQSAIQRENEYYDWVRMTGVLSIHNRRTSPVELSVVKTFEGEGTAASDQGRISRAGNVVGRREAVSEIRWELSLPAGQQKRLTYSYLLHLKSQD